MSLDPGLQGYYVLLDSLKNEKEDSMAVKILIRRNVPENKAREMIPLFRKMRRLANDQPG